MRDEDVIRISVVVPVLNPGPDIIDCLNSLFLQDFEGYEIIIVDNGSKDNIPKILEEYLKIIDKKVLKTDNITIIEESIKGSYVARNAGINKSKGDIIAFTDGDCIANRDWLSKLYQGFNLDNSQDIGCVAGAINARPGQTLIEIYSANKGILSQDITLNAEFLPYGQTANVAFRKEVFEKIGYFDEMLSGGDADLAWRMQLKTNFRLIYRPDAIVWHHHRTTFKGLFRQYFRYGFGNAILEKKYKNVKIKNKLKTKNKKLSLYNRLIASIKRLRFEKYYVLEFLISIYCFLGSSIGMMYGHITYKIREEIK